MSRWKKLRGTWRFAPVLLLAILVVAALVWWQDRPLAEAEAYLGAGDPARALDVLEAHLTRHPAHSRGLALKARSLVALHRWEEASRLFAQAGAATSADLRAWSEALLRCQKWSEALPLLEELEAGGDGGPEVLRDLTICRFQTGDVTAASASATRLAQQPGHEIDGIFLLGVIERAQGNTHLSIEHWERIEALQPDARGLSIPPAEFFRVHAQDLMREGRPRLAITYFERSLRLQEDVHVRGELGGAWAQVGNHEQAAKTWMSVIQSEPTHVEARLGLAGLALQRSDAAAALEWLSPVASEAHVHEEIAYLMQRAHTLSGEDAEAEAWRERAATLRRSRKLQAAFERRAAGSPSESRVPGPALRSSNLSPAAQG